MREYNDYVATTRRWLKNYQSFKVTIENLTDDIDTLAQMNRLDVAAPISKYGDEPGGGTPELNNVERSAEKHIQREKRMAEKRQSIETLELTIRKVDRAIANLSDTEARLVKGHFLENLAWDELGAEFGYTEKWARTHGGKAVRLMAEMIFGPRIVDGGDKQLSFVFAV